MRRFPLLVVVSLVLLAIPLAPASAASACLYDDPTDVATVTVAAGTVTIVVSGDAIMVDGIACGAATVNSTERIDVVTTAAGDHVTIDLSGGAFAPGSTTEGDDSSEIEFDIAGETASVIVVGRDTGDRIGVATDGTDAALNLNDGEDGWDTDVTVAMADLVDVQLQLGGGADLYRADVNAGVGFHPVTTRPVSVSGAVGPDEFAAHPGAVLDGGGGGDELGLDHLGAGCEAIVTNGAATGVESTISGCSDTVLNGTFEVTNVKVILGTSGDDVLFGASWSEELYGLGGADRLIPWTGNDLNVGGPGQDTLIAESANGRRFTFDLSAKTLSGQGTDSYGGIELLVSTSDGADTFVGDPGRAVRFISGGGGPNILDLSDAARGKQIRTQPGTDPAGVEAGWILAQGVIVTGTPFADVMLGVPGAFPNDHDEFRGLGGNDRLEGGAGPDTLSGGPGDDRLRGGSGVDTCTGGPGQDVIRGCEH
jgi:Ca2+-binding RTX toxin-like protein